MHHYITTGQVQLTANALLNNNQQQVQTIYGLHPQQVAMHYQTTGIVSPVVAHYVAGQPTAYGIDDASNAALAQIAGTAQIQRRGSGLQTAALQPTLNNQGATVPQTHTGQVIHVVHHIIPQTAGYQYLQGGDAYSQQTSGSQGVLSGSF